MIRATNPRGYAGCCHAISALDLTDRIGAIKLPTLIVVGEDDPGTPVAASRTIQERIAGSRLEILPSAAHLSNIEQPEAFTTARDVVPRPARLGWPALTVRLQYARGPADVEVKPGPAYAPSVGPYSFVPLAPVDEEHDEDDEADQRDEADQDPQAAAAGVVKPATPTAMLGMITASP